MTDWRLRLPLSLAALVLAAAAVRPWLPDHAATPVPQPTARQAASAPARLAALPPLTHFAATIERPLFSPSRRPAAAPAAGLSGAALTRRYRLQGIIAVGAAKRALLIDRKGGRRLDIGQGETIDGWTVKRIAPDRLILASPAGEATLRLDNGAAAATPTKARGRR